MSDENTNLTDTDVEVMLRVARNKNALSGRYKRKPKPLPLGEAVSEENKPVGLRNVQISEEDLETLLAAARKILSGEVELRDKDEPAEECGLAPPPTKSIKAKMGGTIIRPVYPISDEDD